MTVRVPGILLFLMVAPLVGSSLPAPADPAAMPSPETLMEKVLKASEKEEANEKAFRATYAWYRVRVLQEFNGKGEVTKTERTKKDFYPTHRVNPAPQASQSPTNQPNYRERDFALSSDLINRFTFKLAGRETLRGRPTLLVDFHPADRKLPSTGLKDKFINNTAGRLWIDEEESVIARAAIHLREQVNIAGGLAGAVKLFQYQFERARTSEGLWYVTKSDWKLHARELLAQKHLTCEEHKENVLRVRQTPPR
jgi:hypothetical protein